MLVNGLSISVLIQLREDSLEAEITIANRSNPRPAFIMRPTFEIKRGHAPSILLFIDRKRRSSPVTQSDMISLAHRRSSNRSGGFIVKRRWHCPCSCSGAASEQAATRT